MTAVPTQRLHYLDAMRSVLMLLGLLLHSARPYDTNHWRVKDPQQIPLLDGLVAALQLFRMPGFFLIAGFFAMHLISRRSTPSFLRERMQRVLVPLVAVLLSVNVAQTWFVATQSGVGTENFVADTLLPALWSGQLVSHLWFLACLAVYFAAVALLAPHLRRLATLPAHWSTGRVGSMVFHAALAVAVIAPLGFAVAAKLTAPALNYFLMGLVNVSTLLGYLPFFGFGMMLCAFPAYLDRFATISAGVIGVGSCAAAGIYLGAGREGTAWQALHIVCVSLLTWMVLRLLFSLFRRYADRPSRLFRYLSDASYSIYLLHLSVVVVVATLLAPLDLSAWFKFPIVLTAASVVSLAIYQLLIRRNVVLGYLFGGAIRPAERMHGARRGKQFPMPEMSDESGSERMAASQ